MHIQLSKQGNLSRIRTKSIIKHLSLTKDSYHHLHHRRDHFVKVVTDYINISTKGNTDIHDITSEATRLVEASGLNSGTATIFVHGSTGAVTTIEYESGLVEDMKRMLERVAPQGIEYRHNLRWGDGNGHSHIRASLLGPSLTVPFQNNRLMLGTWQQIIFIDLDNKPRNRDVIVQIMGV